MAAREDMHAWGLLMGDGRRHGVMEEMDDDPDGKRMTVVRTAIRPLPAMAMEKQTYRNSGGVSEMSVMKDKHGRTLGAVWFDSSRSLAA
jgi:hypothetical protein